MRGIPVTGHLGSLRIRRAVAAAVTLAAAASEEATVRFHVHTDRPAFTGLAGTRIVEPGEILLEAGSSSLDTPVRGTVQLVGEERAAVVLRQHAVPVSIERA
jgi:beta-glucosidase